MNDIIYIKDILNKKISINKNYNFTSIIKLTNFLKNDEEINNICLSFIKNHPEYIKPSFLIISILKNIQLPSCKCGKILNYIQYKQGKKYCSKKCAQNDNSTKNKIKQTLLTRYRGI